MTLSTAWGYDGQSYTGKSMRFLAELISQRQGGVLDFPDLKATPSGSPDAKVHLATGNALIQATGASEFGFFEVANDADLASPSIVATGANPRWDLFLLQVVSGVPQVTIVQGTASGSPTYPSLAAQNDYTVICGVKMPANKSIIDNGANGVIDDRRTLFRQHVVCTSTTRPPIPFEGQEITETDTDLRWLWNGSLWIPMDGYGAWQTYTPALTATTTNPTLGSGSQQIGRYRQLGKTVECEARVVFGTSGVVAGAGTYRVSLPVTAANNLSTFPTVGNFEIFDSSANAILRGYLQCPSLYDRVTFNYPNGAPSGTNTVVGATVPWTWAASDELTLHLRYEAA